MGLVLKIYCSCSVNSVLKSLPRGRGTPCDGLYGEAPPERGIFFRLQVYERYVFHLLNYIKGYASLSFGSVKGPKRANR